MTSTTTPARTIALATGCLGIFLGIYTLNVFLMPQQDAITPQNYQFGDVTRQTFGAIETFLKFAFWGTLTLICAAIAIPLFLMDDDIRFKGMGWAMLAGLIIAVGYMSLA